MMILRRTNIILLSLLYASLGLAQELDVRPPPQGPPREIPLDAIEIWLDRSACFGSCPVYSVMIHGNGRVKFDGKQFTAYRGPTTWRIERDDIVELVNRFLGANFFHAAPRYEGREVVEVGPNGGLILGVRGFSDLSGTTLRLKLGERDHSVFLYHDVPQELEELARAVDEVAETSKYVRGSGK